MSLNEGKINKQWVIGWIIWTDNTVDCGVYVRTTNSVWGIKCIVFQNMITIYYRDTGDSD